MNPHQSAAKLLLKAHKAGVRIRLGDDGSLRLSPAKLLTPKRIETIKNLKEQLKSLIGSLGASSEDPLILEALALFDGEITVMKAQETRRT